MSTNNAVQMENEHTETPRFKTVTALNSIPAKSIVNSGPVDNLSYKNRLGVSCPNLIPVESLRDFTEMLKTHIREFTAQHGLSFSELEHIISNDQREAKLTVTLSSLNFFGMDSSAICYIKNCQTYGLKPEWFGQKFSIGSSYNMVITGMDINEATNSVRVRVFTGTTALFLRENSFDRLRAAFK